MDESQNDSAPQMSEFAKQCLKPNIGWKRQSFEYIAAHFLVGSGIVDGDLDGNIRSWAHELRLQYDQGVEDGQKRLLERVPDVSKDG
jgi:hypothetical protein